MAEVLDDQRLRATGTVPPRPRLPMLDLIAREAVIREEVQRAFFHTECEWQLLTIGMVSRIGSGGASENFYEVLNSQSLEAKREG